MLHSLNQRKSIGIMHETHKDSEITLPLNQNCQEKSNKLKKVSNVQNTVQNGDYSEKQTKPNKVKTHKNKRGMSKERHAVGWQFTDENIPIEQSEIRIISIFIFLAFFISTFIIGMLIPILEIRFKQKVTIFLDPIKEIPPKGLEL